MHDLIALVTFCLAICGILIAICSIHGTGLHSADAWLQS